jgi:exosortase
LENHASLRLAVPSIGLIGAALAAIWWMAIRMLWNEWELDPQYSYGFLVPIICIALFLQRWRDRPAAHAHGSLGIVALLALPPLCFLAGIQPFFEANPEWRVPGIAGAFSAVLLTLLLVYSIGGSSWLRHFLFPVCFFIIAIPWPRNAEEAIMGFFMEKNAIAALEVLHWLGYEAFRRGHLITLPSGTLGVEEACSGVRSLQSGIMAALFFGEMFRFSAFIRCGLIFSAVFVALFGNFLRATFLSVIASHEGIAAIEKWHDIAGYAILVSTLGTLWALAHFYNKSRISRGHTATSGDTSEETPPISHAIRFSCMAALLIATISLAGTELWYRFHERGRTNESQWTLKSGSPGTKSVSIPDRTRRMLFFPEGFSERFMDTGGHNWHFFYLRWPAGRTAIQALSIHDPRTCLASIGMVLEKQLPSVTIKIGAENFPFRVFLFRESTRPVLVFHSVIAGGRRSADSEGLDESSEDEDYTLKGRWKVVSKGIRNQGQTLIEAAVWNTSDVKSAANSLAIFLCANMENSVPLQK